MILHVSPESSALVRAAATFILVLHIGAGCMGLLSGGAALMFAKGSPGHRAAGNIFFVSMLLMAAIGAAVSPFLPRPEWVNVVAGAFTFYLVATGWATVKRPGPAGPFEIGAFVVGLLIAVGGVMLGVQARAGLDRGAAPPGATLVFAALAGLAAAGDLRMIVRGRPLSGAERLVRHLWRMCLALFIAAASLFLGQPQVFPGWLRGSPIMFVPELAVLAVMVFWVLRLRFTRSGRARSWA